MMEILGITVSDGGYTWGQAHVPVIMDCPTLIKPVVLKQ